MGHEVSVLLLCISSGVSPFAFVCPRGGCPCSDLFLQFTTTASLFRIKSMHRKTLSEGSRRIFTTALLSKMALGKRLFEQSEFLFRRHFSQFCRERGAAVIFASFHLRKRRSIKKKIKNDAYHQLIYKSNLFPFKINSIVFLSHSGSTASFCNIFYQ